MGGTGVVGGLTREPHSGRELQLVPLQAIRQETSNNHPLGRQAWHPSFIPGQRGHPWRLGLP